jgi:hypothetical protein
MTSKQENVAVGSPMMRAPAVSERVDETGSGMVLQVEGSKDRRVEGSKD